KRISKRPPFSRIGSPTAAGPSISTPPRGSSRRKSRRCSASHDGSTASRSEAATDRKSTRLNSSHVKISYAVFCLKKKKKKKSKSQSKDTRRRRKVLKARQLVVG